jgi:hypothetical protein
MSGIEDELKQKAEQAVEKKTESDLGGSQGGGQPQTGGSDDPQQGDQQQGGGDPNDPQNQDQQQGAGDDAQS